MRQSRLVGAARGAAHQFTSSLLFRNTTAMIVAQGTRVVVQAIYFIVIARALGSEGYGAFIAVVALASVVAPFASWGGGDLLVQSVANSRASFSYAWGSALAYVVLIGSALVAVFGFIALLVLPRTIPFTLVVLIAAAEFWFFPVVNIGGQAYQAFERLGRTGMIWLTLSLIRLLAAGALVYIFTTPTPLQWAFLYLASTALTAVLVITLVSVELGPPRLSRQSISRSRAQGFFFSLSLAAAGISNDIDKTMLARLSTLGVAGAYAAGYRIVELTFVPIMAILFSSYPRFFEHGSKGVAFAVGYARKLLPPSIGYALLAGMAIWVAAPVVPLFLGQGYESTSEVIRWLAPLPVLRTISFFGASALTGSGHQATRSVAQLGTAGLNITLNLWLIPRYGWRGAVAATLATETMLALGLWAILQRFLGAERSRSLSPSMDLHGLSGS